MNLFGEILRTLGFGVRVRRAGLAYRIRALLTLVLLAVSTGTAIGYAVVNRGRAPWDDTEDAPDDAG